MVLFVLAFLAAWVALYVVAVRPKLHAYRATAGIYARLDALEAGLWPRAVLLLKGVKVLIAGFVTSSAPVAAVFYDKVSGLDWTQFVSSERARTITAIVTLLGVAGPMLMVALHNGSLAEAAAIEPQPQPKP